MTDRPESLRRAWEARRRAPRLVTTDGFGPHAVVVVEATGCLLWQGCMAYKPKAMCGVGEGEGSTRSG